MGNLDLSFFTWDMLSNFVLKGFIFSIELTVMATVGGILFGTVLALMLLLRYYLKPKPTTLPSPFQLQSMPLTPKQLPISPSVIGATMSSAV